jgi:hypothetical protein
MRYAGTCVTSITAPVSSSHSVARSGCAGRESSEVALSITSNARRASQGPPSRSESSNVVPAILTVPEVSLWVAEPAATDCVSPMFRNDVTLHNAPRQCRAHRVIHVACRLACALKSSLMMRIWLSRHTETRCTGARGKRRARARRWECPGSALVEHQLREVWALASAVAGVRRFFASTARGVWA